MVRAVIVDDEIGALRGMELLLEHCCPEVQVVGTAQNIQDARDLINTKRPNLLFLDVELTHTTGFDLLKITGQKDFVVIFVTAHDRHAIPAIKADALDFLLKPVETSDLIIAVEKAKERLNEKVLISEQNASGVGTPHRLEVPTRHGMRFIDYQHIEHIEADGNYSTLFLGQQKAIVVSRQLGSFEATLPEKEFLRIHKSYIINLNHMVAFERLDGGIVEMTSGKRLEVSKKYKPDLLEAIKAHSLRL